MEKAKILKTLLKVSRIKKQLNMSQRQVSYGRGKPDEKTKGYQVAQVTSGKFDFNDYDVFHILSKQKYFPGFDNLGRVDYFMLLSCFILAGADIRTRVEKGTVNVKILIDPKDRSGFMERFEKLISERYGSLKARLRASEEGSAKATDN